MPQSQILQVDLFKTKFLNRFDCNSFETVSPAATIRDTTPFFLFSILALYKILLFLVTEIREKNDDKIWKPKFFGSKQLPRHKKQTMKHFTEKLR